MKLAMVGLGKMGLNMSIRLKRRGHAVVGVDSSPRSAAAAARAGVPVAPDLAAAVARLKPPRVVWLMVPAGAAVRRSVETLAGLLEAGDIVIDGGNSRYSEAAENARRLGQHGIGFMDVGVSGGIWGLREGYCLMAGGSVRNFKRVSPLLKALAPPEGFARVGPVGAGHFVKMVHNGVEYALMQAYAEGFALLRAAPFSADLHRLCRLWNRGSVVRSWLLELAQEAFRRDPELKGLRGWVEDSGEGRWTVDEAVARAVPAPVITLSLFERFRSRLPDAFSDRVLAALRQGFGGHAVRARGRAR